MSNPSEARCPRCAAPLPPNAPEGLCPRCLGALNLATETVPTGADAPGASPQPPLTPAELAPHFPQLEILECLGRGGMGVVYKARQKTLNRVVALKLLAPERVTDAGFAERFTREAQALARLNHPNIVTIHDFGCTRAGAQPETGFYFLLMEFVDGVNLRQAMKAGRFTPEQALAIVPPVCEALQYAHEQGIVHRDIKPENLLLDKAGRIKIADFGIAKMLETGGAELPLGHSTEAAQQRGPASQESLAAGTPQYMAPEQRTAPQRTDHRADIYSLGVVLYELLTGELPGAKLQPPSRRVQIDVRLDEIVLRALETKPELRYATAAEFRTQVENITDSAAGSDAMRPGEPTWFKPVGLLYVLAGLLGWLPTVASLGAHVVTHHAAVMLSATGLALLTRHRWWRWLAIGTNTLAIVNYLLSHAMLLGLASFGRIPSGSPWPNDMGGVAREMARHAPDNLLILAGFGCGIWLLFRPDARAAFASQCFTHREHNVIGGLAVAALVGGLLPFVWPYLAFNPYAHLVKAGGVFGLAAWCLLRGGTAAAPLRLSPVWGISLRVLVAVVAIGLALLVGFLVLAGLYRSREATMMAQRAALAAKQQAHNALGSQDPSAGAPQINAATASPITSSIAASDNSPEAIAAAQQRGIASATRDIQAGIFRILRYGLLVKTDGTETDEETGFRIQWVAGSILSNQFRAEADAYNFAMRDRYWTHEHWKRKAAVGALEPQGPHRVAASATNATAMDFRVLKVEAPPGLRYIRVHFQCAVPAGIGFEVCQDVTRGPYGEAPKSEDAFWLRTKWVGLNDPPVLVWTLPEDFTPEEVQAGAKQVEAHLRTMRDALRMLPTEAVSSFGKVRHREGWLYELVLRVKSARDHSPVQAADAWVVEGTVRDGEGKPMPEADIHVSSGAGSLFVTGKGKTGADGTYRVGFGPGISMSAGDRRGAMQAAIVHVGKAGFEEKELGNGGNLQMAWELTPQQFAGGWQPGPQRTFLPGKPLRVDFVLLPAATVRGTLLTPDGKPVPSREIVLVGERLRPASSIYASAKTDADGRFTFKDVSTQHAWSFSIENTPHHRKRTAPDRFAEARAHEVTLIADGDDLRRGDTPVKPKDGAGANLSAAPRVATTEGKYDLASGVTLVITAKPPRGTGGKPFDGRLDWPKSATNPKAVSFDVALSEGAPFAVGWRADGHVLWVACGGGDGTDNSIRYVRKLTIAGPGNVDEQSWDAREKQDFGGLPAELRRVFDTFIAPSPATNRASALEDELIRLAQQRLQQIRLQQEVGRAGLLDVIEAEGVLAVAEARSNALKQAEARLITATTALELIEKLHLAGRSDVETAIQAKQRKLAAELEIQRLRAGSPAPPAKP